MRKLRIASAIQEKEKENNKLHVIMFDQKQKELSVSPERIPVKGNGFIFSIDQLSQPIISSPNAYNNNLLFSWNSSQADFHAPIHNQRLLHFCRLGEVT